MRPSLSQYGHMVLSLVGTVHQANAVLQRASDGMAPLGLQGLSFSWRMVHFGQGAYAPGDRASNHVHKQLHMESIIDGCFRFAHEPGTLDLNSGQSLLVLPQEQHRWECVRAGLMMGALINVSGQSSHVFLETARQQSSGMIAVGPASSPVLHRELIRLLTESVTATWRLQAVSSVLRLLMIDVLDAAFDLSPWRPKVDEAVADARTRELCRHAREFLEANYAQPIQVGDVALQIGVSARHLNRLYRRIHGESIGASLGRVRLERAREHLREHPGDLVKTVAYKCGFSSPAYFTACYRNAFGCVPGADRRPGY